MFIQSQVLSQEYLSQASNFSPRVRELIALLMEKVFFKQVRQSYEDVSKDEHLSVMLNKTLKMTVEEYLKEQKGLVNTMYFALTKYVEELRSVQNDLRNDIRDVALDELATAQISLIMSVVLLGCIALLAPVILLFNRNVAVMGRGLLVGHHQKGL